MKALSRILFTGLCLAAMASLAWSVPASAATSNHLMWALPSSGISYPVYIYSNGVQVGYVYGPAQQAFVGPYDPAATSGSYDLYYQEARAWRDCKMVLAAGKIDAAGTTCPGAVINKPQDRSNVYTITTGALAWPRSDTPPVNPLKTDYGKRRITFVNNTQYDLIQVGEVCTKANNPNNPNCRNTENLFQIPKGGRAVFKVDNATAEGQYYPAGLDSVAFHLSAYKDASGTMVKTGGYNVGGGPTYATKIEFFIPAVDTSSGNPVPNAAGNIDMSVVDGYNIGVKAYPDKPTYCTYTVPPSDSNILGAGRYGRTVPIAALPRTDTTTLADVCNKSSQLPAGDTTGTQWDLTVTNANKDFLGCMSPCTYAKKTSDPLADLFCCDGAYNTPAACIQAKGVMGANTSTYVTNLNPKVSKHFYRYAYDDAVGDYACPAETSFVISFE